jgi:hypothetical protein
MIKLNLPSFEINLKKANGKVWIFDFIRKKYVVLTPEEWVRQHFIHYLVESKGYPKALIKVETGLRYNSLVKRSDVLIYDRQGSVWMVIECKAGTETISDETALQVSTYNSTLKAPFVTMTNGMVHVCFQVDHESMRVVKLNELPAFE